MAILNPTVFNRIRPAIDIFTDASHRLVQQLDGEAANGNAHAAAKDELQRLRRMVADLGYQFDSSDPDGGDAAAAWGLRRGVDVHGGLILTPAQAEAVYSAMCALNNVGGSLCCRLDEVRIEAWDDVHIEGPGDIDGECRHEHYADQNAFATAYGLNTGA